MSGGILLPGNAATTDVATGKTFSSGPAGLSATGTVVSRSLPGTLGAPIFSVGIGVNNNTTVQVNVPTGCPIIIAIWSVTGSGNASGISDNFSTPYSWSKIDAVSAGDTNSRTELWQGTQGAGTSGTITATGLNGDYCVAAIPAPACPFGTSTIVDVHGHNSGNTTAASLSLTPNHTSEAGIFVVGQYYASHALNWSASGSPAGSAWSFYPVPTHQLTDQYDLTSLLAITQVAGLSAIDPFFTFDGGSADQWTITGAVLLNG